MKLVYIILLIASVFAIRIGVQAASDALHLGISLTANHGIGQILMYVIGIGAVVTFIDFVWKRSLRSAFGVYWSQRKRFLAGFFFGCGMSLVFCTALYTILIKSHSGIVFQLPKWDTLVTTKWIVDLVVAFFTTAVLACTEEAIFRGFLFNYFRGSRIRHAWAIVTFFVLAFVFRRIEAALIGGLGMFVFEEIVDRIALASGKSAPWRSFPLNAIALSGTIFAVYHQIVKPGASIVGSLELLASLIVLGMSLAAIYWLTRSLAVSAGVHAGLIWMEIIKDHTGAVKWHQTHWYLGSGAHQDVRTAPVVWLLFLCIVVLMRVFSPWLKRHFAIEGRSEGTHTEPDTDSIPVSNKRVANLSGVG